MQQDNNQHPQLLLLDEGEVCNGFDYLVQTAVAEAKNESLIPPDGIGGDVDASVVGPTLCLYYTALRAGSGLPSVQLPHLLGGGAIKHLQSSTCPFKFIDLFGRWTGIVPHIQNLSRPHQIDLGRIICNQSVPSTSNTHTPYSTTTPVQHIANYLRSIASDILRFRVGSSQDTKVNFASILGASAWPEPKTLIRRMTPYEAPYPAPYGIPPSPPAGLSFCSPQSSPLLLPRSSPQSPRHGPVLGLLEQDGPPRLPTLPRSLSSSTPRVIEPSSDFNDDKEYIGEFIRQPRPTASSPTSTNSQMPFPTPILPNMSDPRPTHTLFRNKSVGHAPSCVHDMDDVTGPTNHIATVISSNMSISDIIANLGRRGCRDLSYQLDLASCTARPISRGAFSDVYFGKLYDGTPVAIKTIFIYNDADDQERKHLKRTARELYTWSKCEHPNVARLLGLAKFRDQIAMVSLWVKEGDLRTYINQRPSVNRFELCIQIADGLAYLHSIGIIHGDLKGANVLISKAGTAALIDFGNAALGESTLQFTQTGSNNFIGARWAAPELFTGGKHNAASDVYALGMTILEAFTGKVPYFGRADPAVMITAVVHKKVPDRPQEIPTNVVWGDMLWDLLVNCWRYIPSERPAAHDVCRHLKEISPTQFFSAPSIMTHLRNHDCTDLTGALDISTCLFPPMEAGGRSSVYLGELVGGMKVAVRPIDEVFSNENSSRLEHAARELHMWTKCSHPNVARLLGLANIREQVALLSPWMENGDLRGYINKYRDVDRYNLSAQVANGLAYLHSLGIIHGDLKASNVLVSGEGTAMLTGFQRVFSKYSKSKPTRARPDLHPSTRWMAPEMLQEGGEISAETDVYALGMTILEIFTGEVPYVECQTEAAVILAVVGSRRMPDRPHKQIPPDNKRGDRLWTLLTECWHRKPHRRPTAEKVYKIIEPFIVDGAMTTSEIIAHLGSRNCPNLSDQLEPSLCGGDPITRGGYGTIYRGALKTGRLVALKCTEFCIGSGQSEREHLQRTTNELYTWSKCNHRNVVQLLGLAIFRNQIAMVSPWMKHGDLKAYIKQNPHVNRCDLCVQVTEGLSYLHRNHIVHGDIKAANVLVSDHGIAMLADFGSAILKLSTLKFAGISTECMASVRWAAPETLSDSVCSTQADVYALGMTILEIITGKVPHSEKAGDLQVLYAVMNQGETPDRPEQYIPASSRDGDRLWSLLLQCWSREGAKRPKPAQVEELMKTITKEGLFPRT